MSWEFFTYFRNQPLQYLVPLCGCLSLQISSLYSSIFACAFGVKSMKSLPRAMSRALALVFLQRFYSSRSRAHIFSLF